MRIRISRNLFIVLLLDIILWGSSFYLAHLIRYDFVQSQWVYKSFLHFLPYIILCKILCFYFFDLYRGMWRYTSLNDLISIAKASIVAMFIIIALVLYLTRFEDISRSVFVIDFYLTVFFISSLRLSVRLCFEEFTEKITLQDVKYALFKVFRKKNVGDLKGTLIIGAGDYGQKVCREFKENPSVKSRVLGFLDDDPSKIGRKIHGVSVLNTIENLGQTVKLSGAEDVIIAIPSLGADRMRQIVGLCKKADVDFKTIPNLGELINGKIDVTSIRKVEYRDLLGREPVKLDQEQIGKYLGGKRVLVTGAGGSIGTGLCRQICRYSPEKIILFERAESPLYEIDLELKKNFQNIEVVPVLGDIQNREELDKVFHQLQPEIVFHAAAYKHVPMLEEHPWKAVENNVFGTKNLIEVSKAFKCDKFVFVSTDKAVNPTNVMGTSKRIAELLVQEIGCADGNSGTSFMTVRFGNVIGSVGSVIPLFKKQIAEGGPVTVTHPDIVRFFMLIPEACQLILQAGAMGNGGEIFLLEMGEPINIDNMARDLIRFSGFEPDGDIKIEYTGLRPGEKLYEELMTDIEDVVPTGHKKIMVLNTSCLNPEVLNGKLSLLKEKAKDRDGAGIRSLMKEMIPEYRPTG